MGKFKRNGPIKFTGDTTQTNTTMAGSSAATAVTIPDGATSVHLSTIAITGIYVRANSTTAGTGILLSGLQAGAGGVTIELGGAVTLNANSATSATPVLLAVWMYD